MVVARSAKGRVSFARNNGAAKEAEKRGIETERDVERKAELRRSRIFRKIEKDIKDQNRRRRKDHQEEAAKSGAGTRVWRKTRNQETYVDKDRQIAVRIGEGVCLCLLKSRKRKKSVGKCFHNVKRHFRRTR